MTLKNKIGSVVIPRLPVSRRTFDILRFELAVITERMRNALNPRYHLKVRSVRKGERLAINLGSGGRGLDGWINIDALSRHKDIMFALDIRRPLIFRDGQVRCVYAEHVVEHIDYRQDVPRLFAEVYRVLEPGGVFRIVVPDAERYLAAYVSRDPARWRELGWDLNALPADLDTPMHVINHVFHQGGEHLFAYDFATMSLALKRAGFTDVRQQTFRASLEPMLEIDRDEHRLYSLYVDARK